MGEQQDLAQLTGIENADDDSGSDDSTSSADSDRGTLEGIVTHSRNRIVNEQPASRLVPWVTERQEQEENYGYFHLYVVAKSDLSGTERHLRYGHEIKHPGSGDGIGPFNDRFGRGGIRAEEVRDELIDWKLRKLALPLHPELRDVPASNLRVFVADPVHEFLREQGIEIETLVDRLNHLGEHTPSDEQLEKRREYREVFDATAGVSPPLEQRIRTIEDTIRVRFALSGRHGGSIPNPDPEFEDHSLEQLRTELEQARNDFEQTNQRKNGLRQEIADDEARWVEEMRTTLFA